MKCDNEDSKFKPTQRLSLMTLVYVIGECVYLNHRCDRCQTERTARGWWPGITAGGSDPSHIYNMAYSEQLYKGVTSCVNIGSKSTLKRVAFQQDGLGVLVLTDVVHLHLAPKPFCNDISASTAFTQLVYSRSAAMVKSPRRRHRYKGVTLFVFLHDISVNRSGNRLR